MAVNQNPNSIPSVEKEPTTRYYLGVFMGSSSLPKSYDGLGAYLPISGLTLSLLGHLAFGLSIAQFDFAPAYEGPIVYEIGIVQEDQPVIPQSIDAKDLQAPLPPKTEAVKKSPAKNVREERKEISLSTLDKDSPQDKKENIVEGPSVGSELDSSSEGETGGGSGLGVVSVDYGINPKPKYPESARRARVEGLVTLSVTVMEDGLVGDIRVSTSSGTAVLDDAALKAVKKWRFRPAMVSGHAVSSSVEVPVRFKLVD